MSRSGDIRFFYGDKDRALRLGIGELIELEEAVPAWGAEMIGQRLRAGVATINEGKTVWRLALMGGGLDREEAFDLVEYWHPKLQAEGKLADLQRKAGAIIGVAYLGAPEELDDAVAGEQPGGTAPSKARRPSRTAAPAGAPGSE